MTLTNTFFNPLKIALLKYQGHLLAMILALSTLPVGFFYAVQNNLDGAWVRAINIAINNNSVFGKDIVFTFGPLGYLSTRNTQYIHDIYLFLFDVFIVICFSYIFYKLLSESKKWFWIILVCVFYFKGTESSQILFLLFVVFVSLNLLNGFRNFFEVVVTAICGVVVFFIKINFGFFMAIMLPLIILYVFFKNRKSFLLFTITAGLIFWGILLKTNIDIFNYLRHGIDVIAYYGEAMQIHLEPTQTNFLWSLIFCTLFIIFALHYFVSQIRSRKLSFDKVVILGLLSIFVYLSYRNAFTRNDGHNDGFFAVIPLFFVLLILVLGYSKVTFARFVCVLVIIISDTNLNLPHAGEGRGFIYNSFGGSFINYCSTIFKKQVETVDPAFVIPNNKLEILGKNTIDIFPIDVFVLQQNNLNYLPRPVMQSYSAYSGSLDSLNAAHFYSPRKRPEYVMFWTWSIDNRYPMWDESETKAMLRMNYSYSGSISTRSDSNFSNEYGYYLLFKSKNEEPKKPKYEKLYEQVVNFKDTVNINFPDTSAIYASVDIDYSNKGKLNNIFFQPAIIDITLLLLSDTLSPKERTFRAVKPIMKEPVLINKFIEKNSDFINYITGSLMYNRNINAFYFTSNRQQDFDNKIKITFYKLSNY